MKYRGVFSVVALSVYNQPYIRKSHKWNVEDILNFISIIYHLQMHKTTDAHLVALSPSFLILQNWNDLCTT